MKIIQLILVVFLLFTCTCQASRSWGSFAREMIDILWGSKKPDMPVPSNPPSQGDPDEVEVEGGADRVPNGNPPLIIHPDADPIPEVPEPPVVNLEQPSGPLQVVASPIVIDTNSTNLIIISPSDPSTTSSTSTTSTTSTSSTSSTSIDNSSTSTTSTSTIDNSIDNSSTSSTSSIDNSIDNSSTSSTSTASTTIIALSQSGLMVEIGTKKPYIVDVPNPNLSLSFDHRAILQGLASGLANLMDMYFSALNVDLPKDSSMALTQPPRSLAPVPKLRVRLISRPSFDLSKLLTGLRSCLSSSGLLEFPVDASEGTSSSALVFGPHLPSKIPLSFVDSLYQVLSEHFTISVVQPPKQGDPDLKSESESEFDSDDNEDLEKEGMDVDAIIKEISEINDLEKVLSDEKLKKKQHTKDTDDSKPQKTSADTYNVDQSNIKFLDPLLTDTKVTDNLSSDPKPHSPQEQCITITPITPPANILSLPAHCFSTMPGDQLALIPPAVISKLSPEQLSNIPGKKIEYLQNQPSSASHPSYMSPLNICISLVMLCILAL